MLTLEENGWNFKAIQIYSVLNLIPIEIDMKTGKIQRQSSKIRIFLWRLLVCFGIAHWVYLLEKLADSTLWNPEKYGDFRWDNVVIHSACTIGYFLHYLIIFSLFQLNPDKYVMVFNQLFVVRENPVQKIIDEEKKKKDQGKRRRRNKNGADQKSAWASDPIPAQVQVRSLFTWPLKYSAQELYARITVINLFLPIILLLVVFLMEPTRPQLLFNGLPEEFKNSWSFVALVPMETLILTIMFSLSFVGLLAQILFFSKCQFELNRLNSQLKDFKEKFQNCETSARDRKTEIWILEQILGSLQELAIFIDLFNHCFCYSIFLYKINCLSISILFYFFTIRHYQEYPEVAFFTAYGAFSLTGYYILLYQQGFFIPQKIKEFKNEFLVAAQKSCDLGISKTNQPQNRNQKWAEMQSKIKRIPDVGIKVGSFHTLERESTPNYINFVINQVVTLLVTFPKP